MNNPLQVQKHPALTRVFATLLGLTCSIPAYAERFALLVGVSDYPVKPLNGPVNDVRAIQKVLVQRWAFKEKNIVSIVNREATRENILNTINKLYTQTHADDEVFIYLSGHGTSAEDNNSIVTLPTTTGAYIPYDIAKANSPDEISRHLIIGNRDLQPLLSKFDHGNRRVFVAIDACYSGNTVRGAFQKNALPTRAMGIKEILKSRGFGDDIPASAKPWQAAASSGNTATTPYPYQNIYYLSAAGEHEPAQDIPPDLLKIYPTLDGKPHGAFTDTLLRVLNKEIDSDSNQDGYTSYSELKQAVRNLMRIRGFDHTPQGLPTLAEDRANLAQRAVFGVGRESTAAVALAPRGNGDIGTGDGRLRLFVAPDLKSLQGELSTLSGLALTGQAAEMRLEKQGNGAILVSSAGDLIAAFATLDTAAITTALRAQSKVHQWLNTEVSAGFNLDFDMHGRGRGATAVAGESVGFSARTSEAAYLLIVDIDPYGLISVLYPYSAAELAPVPANQALNLIDMSVVRAPYGTDHVFAYAFDHLTDELRALQGKNFAIDQPLAGTFERLLTDKTLKKARATLTLVTTAAGGGIK
ncbi:MAG: caspase family protein [Pseudomonadota bacterium]